MLGERSLFRPTPMNETSNSCPQQGQSGSASRRCISHGTVSRSESNGRPRSALRSRIPARITLARALTGARARNSRRFLACPSAYRSAYSCWRRGFSRPACLSFHCLWYARQHGRHTFERPSEQALCGTKCSIVLGYSVPHFEQGFMSFLYHEAARKAIVWGNETDKFAPAESAAA
jgi:hypothetical protein